MGEDVGKTYERARDVLREIAKNVWCGTPIVISSLRDDYWLVDVLAPCVIACV